MCRTELSVAVRRASALTYWGHRLPKMPAVPGGSDLGVTLGHPYSFGETQIGRFSWDTLALSIYPLSISIYPLCLESILVYFLQCGRWALARSWLLIGRWSSFLGFLASTIPVKNRQEEGSYRGGTATKQDSVQCVTWTFHKWLRSQVGGTRHPPWEAPPQQGFTAQY